MLKIKAEKIKDLEELSKIPRGSLLAVRGKVEKILSIENNELFIEMKTIRPELGELQMQGNYAIETYYTFNSNIDLDAYLPDKIITSKVSEEYYQDLKK